MEDLCGAAVKEEAVEAKLRGLAEQWALEAFTFADHKQRGPVVLKVGRRSALRAAGCRGWVEFELGCGPVQRRHPGLYLSGC